MKIAVMGMGKIGLPLAVQYAKKGHDVIGVDINSHTVDLINKGIEPFPEEKNLQEFLTEVINNKKLTATLNYEEAVSSSEAIVVVVPLFVDENAQPDFAGMDNATENIGKFLKKGALVCYETTLPIGTTRSRFTPILESESGMKVGKDFSVVFSPERVFTGRIFEDLKKYPKIVGGVTDICLEKGIHFYNQVIDFDIRPDLPKQNGVWRVDSAESAEFVKLAETTYRDVNIALANQFAIHADSIGVNIYEIIEGANSQFYSHLHQPGISVGGHCIPVYPQFYLWNDAEATVVREARIANSKMPAYVITRMEEEKINLKNKNVLIFGVSYRENVKETSHSGSNQLRDLLELKGANVYACDELFNDKELEELGFNPITVETKKDIDILIIHVKPTFFTKLCIDEMKNLELIYDGRNFLRENNADYGIRIIKLGIG